jgi:ABC-type glycerol-3-phosphate transport system substrate-binding protein
MPVLASVYDDPVIQKSPYASELKSWMGWARDYGQMERWPENYNQLAEILAKAAQKMVYANAPIKETLDQAAAEYKALSK